MPKRHQKQIVAKQREIQQLQSGSAGLINSEKIAILEAEIGLLRHVQDGQPLQTTLLQSQVAQPFDPKLLQSLLERNVKLMRELSGQELFHKNQALIEDNKILTVTNKTINREKADLKSELETMTDKVSALTLQIEYQANHVELATAKADKAVAESVTSQDWFWNVWNDTKAAAAKAEKVEAEAQEVKTENKSLARKLVILQNALGAVNKELSPQGFGNVTVGLPGNIQTTKDGKTFNLNFSHRPVKRDRDEPNNLEAPSPKAAKVANTPIDRFRLEMLIYDTVKNEFMSKGSIPVSISKNDTLAKVTQFCESKLPALSSGQQLSTIVKTESAVHEGSYREVTRDEYARWSKSLKMCDRELACRVFVFPKTQEQQAKAAVRIFN